MKIWLLNPYGPIPSEGWRDYRFMSIGKELSKRGHEVVWWTANFAHHFKCFRSKSWLDISVADNFKIRLVPTTSYSKNISLQRLKYECIYCWNVYHRGQNDSPPNLIVGADPPQMTGTLAVKMASKFKIPVLLDVLDLWPELFNLALPKPLRSLDKLIWSPFYSARKYNLNNANGVVAICETYLLLARKVAPKLSSFSSTTVFNGIDVSEARKRFQDQRRQLKSFQRIVKKDDDVFAVYAGSLGANYDILTLLDAAVMLKDINSCVKVIIAGSGPLHKMVVDVISAQNLSNVLYLEKLDVKELESLYDLCDIGICAYGPESTVALPVKFYDYVAAGLPIVSSLKGELETIILDRKIGVQYDAGVPSSLAAAIDTLSRNSELRLSLAHNSFNLAREFDCDSQYAKYGDFIENIAAHGSF